VPRNALSGFYLPFPYISNFEENFLLTLIGGSSTFFNICMKHSDVTERYLLTPGRKVCMSKYSIELEL
jgi:hypothetical protein